MIDDVVLKWEIDPLDQVRARIGLSQSFDYYGFLFDPFYRQGVVIKYISNYRNLRLIIKDDIFLVYGSWHKFYHSENFGVYTWDQIRETIRELEERFGEKFSNASIIKMTIGCNVSLEAKKILPKVIGINGKKPSDMLGGTNHQTYGKYYKMTFYRYKIYDKKFEVNWHDHKKIHQVLRIEKEIVMKAARKRINCPISILKPIDFLKQEFVCICQREMKDFTDKIEFIKELNFCDFDKAADLEIFRLMKDMDSRLAYKKLANPKTYRSKLRRHRQLVETFSQNSPDLGELLSAKVAEKMSELSGNFTPQIMG